MTQPNSASTTPDRSKQQDKQRSQRRAVLQPQTDMFGLPQSAMVETPDRGQRVMPSEIGTLRPQLVETVRMSSTAKSRGNNTVYGASGNNNQSISSPNNAQQTQAQQTNNRAGDGTEDRQAQSQDRTTLVPNFRSISPSIFNIDLNQTAAQREQVNANASQQVQQSNSNRNQIYVSIHQSKRNEAEAGGQTSYRTAGIGASMQRDMRIRRIGPLQNRGDKIKFGVLISRESKRKSQQDRVDFLQPHEIFETPKQLQRQGRIAVGKHSDAVNRIMNEYSTYTTTKTLPSALVNNHMNRIKQFNKNFSRETDAYSRHSYAVKTQSSAGAGGQAAGYFTDTESFKTRLKDLTSKHKLGVSGPNSKRSFWTDDKNMINIRDVIEEHARSVSAIRRQAGLIGGSNAIAQIDEQRRRRNREIEEKGRKLASELNLSPLSCCTRAERFLRSLNSAQQPIRRHNKPLTHLLRPNQKLIIERQHNAASEQRKRLADEKNQLKRLMAGLSASQLYRDMKGGMSQVKGGVQLREETSQIIEQEQEKYRNRMRPKRAKDDWEQQRKDAEDNIDNGMTYSHLSRQYPMKREWAKYLVLLKKKEIERRTRQRKIRELIEDLNERGVVDDKQVANELDLFEYAEFKKRRDKNKKRMGAKVQGKYYRPVDTERTLKIEPISMGLSDDYDDGPGGFKLEDFEGVETMFSKQTLEMRKLRVDRARERLREKRLKKIGEAKLEAHFNKLKLMNQLQTSNLIQNAEGQQILEQTLLQQQQPLDPIENQFLGQDQPNINVDDQRQPRNRYEDRRLKSKQIQDLTGQIDKKTSSITTPLLQQEHILQRGQTNVPFVSKTIDSDKRDTIQVQVSNRLNQDTLKSSQAKDYSLEDGGIFEKKTVQEGSNEEAKLIGQTITQSSLEMLRGQKHDISSESQIEVDQQYSQRQAAHTLQHDAIIQKRQFVLTNQEQRLQKYASTQGGIPIQPVDQAAQIKQTNANLKVLEGRSSKSPHGIDERTVSKETELMDSADVDQIGGIMQRDGVQMSLQGAGVQRVDQLLQRKIRPSTTENVGRIFLNKPRQVMSGIAQRVEKMRSSAADEKNIALLSRTNPGLTQKSAGMMPTVQYQRLKQNAMQKLVNQSSSLANVQKRKYTPNDPTNSTGLQTDARPSGVLLSGSGGAKAGQVTIRHSGATPNVVGYSGYDGQTTGALTCTQSGIGLRRQMTSTGVMEHWRSEHKKIIWKEIMRAKEEKQLDGDARVSRQVIRSIRNRIRRQRKKRAQKEGFGSHLYNLANSEPNLNQKMLRRRTQQDPAKSPSMDQTVRHTDKTSNSRKVSERTTGRLADSVTPIHDIVQATQQLPVSQMIEIESQARDIQNMNTTLPNPVDRGYLTGPTVPRGDSLSVSDKNLNPSTPREARTLNQMEEAVRPESQSQESMELVQAQDMQPAPGEFVLSYLPPLQNGTQRDMTSINQLGIAQVTNLHPATRKNFVEFNRNFVRDNSLRKKFTSSLNMSRLPKMRGSQKPESRYQSRLQENMARSAMQFNQKTNLGLRTRIMRQPMPLQRLTTQASAYVSSPYVSQQSTSAMYPAFQDKIMDHRSMAVFHKNELRVDPEIDNEFSRQQIWNETLNCPYRGLVSLRQTQDKSINSVTRQENILMPFTTGNRQDRRHINKVKTAINHRNMLREMDEKVYSLIEACQETKKIEWKQIYDQNEDFRSGQRKKIQDTEAPTIEDLLELGNF